MVTRSSSSTRTGGRPSRSTPRSSTPPFDASRGRRHSSVVRAAPVEREVLALAAVPFPLEAETFRPVGGRDAPGGRLTWTDLGARRVVNLDALALGCRRARQRLCASGDLAGDRRAPVGEIVGDLELDRDVLDPSHLADHVRELAGPAARLPAEDRLQACALGVVGALVDEDPHRHLPLVGPDVAGERPKRDDVQVVERCVAEGTHFDVPGEDALAIAFARGLRERAGTRDRALADVEPIADEAPLRGLSHERSFSTTAGGADYVTAWP